METIKKSITFNNNQSLRLLKQEVSIGIILQNYCNTVLKQGEVDFSSNTKLAELQTDINNSLASAKRHANSFLLTISPGIIKSIAVLNNYFTLYSAVPTVLPTGSSEAEWIKTLQTLKEVSEANQKSITAITEQLYTLYVDLKEDSTAFKNLATTINNKVNGDNGELETLESELNNLDLEIVGTSVAVAFGALGIIGGALMICIGAVSGFITAGTSSELVISGVFTVVMGVGTEIGSAIALHGLLIKKEELIQTKANLSAEVSLISAIGSALNSLSNEAKVAYEAARTMENSWRDLSNDMNSLIDGLKNGILSAATIREMFLTEANTSIKSIQTDINTIKDQIAGIVTSTAPSGTTLVNYLAELKIA